MGDGDDCSGISLQVLLEPGHRLGIEMIRWLIQKEDVGLFQKDAAKRDTPLLSARKNAADAVRGRAAQGIHGHLKPAVKIPGRQVVKLLLHCGLAVDECLHFIIAHRFGKFFIYPVELLQEIDCLLNTFFDDLTYCFFRIKMRFLVEIIDRQARCKYGLPVVILVDSREYSQKCTFAGSVQPQHADLGSVEVGKGDVFQNWFAVIIFTDLDHRIDDLFIIGAHMSL